MSQPLPPSHLAATLVALLLALAPLSTTAQGFAGLGTTAEGFAQPTPGTPLTFPADHAAHPAYRIEWWYLTATLTAADGTPLGAQWTLFRSASAPNEGTNTGWSSPQVWMGHAAVTTPSAHYATERLARGGTGQAGVTAAPFSAFIDDWQMTSTAPAPADPLSALRLTASAPQFTYDLALTASAPLTLHGDAGYSVKSAAGQASYYYSQPFYNVTGTLALPSGPMQVTGEAWLDREWSSQPLADNQDGWDWVSLSFTSGARLMGFRLRQTDGTAFTSATWITPEGRATAYPDGALTLTPLAESPTSGATVPTTWRVTLPARGVDTTLTALNPNAWMDVSFPYWEGPVAITGSHTGRGYLEMTGYD